MTAVSFIQIVSEKKKTEKRDKYKWGNVVNIYNRYCGFLKEEKDVLSIQLYIYILKFMNNFMYYILNMSLYTRNFYLQRM